MATRLYQQAAETRTGEAAGEEPTDDEEIVEAEIIEEDE